MRVSHLVLYLFEILRGHDEDVGGRGRRSKRKRKSKETEKVEGREEHKYTHDHNIQTMYRYSVCIQYMTHGDHECTLRRKFFFVDEV